MLNLLSDDLRLILSIVLALAIGWNVRIPVFRMAIRKNFVDKPNNRSSHKGVVPNIGGVVVFLAFLVSFLLFARFNVGTELQYVLLGAIIIFLVGVYDDLLGISPRKKFNGEILGVLVLIIGGGFYLTNLHGLIWYEIIPWFGITLTMVGLLGLINAVNLIDGIDGLCSGVALMDTLFFGVWFYNCGQIEYALLCGILCASLVPFFIVNLFGKRSKMFMGDSGALMVGFLLGVLSVKFCEINIDLTVGECLVKAAPAVVTSVLAIPIMDTLRLFISRWVRGKSPFAPDKRHLHHKLLIIFNGVHKKATYTILSFNLCFILLGIMGRNWSNYVLIGCDIALFAVIFYLVNRRANQVAARQNRK